MLNYHQSQQGHLLFMYISEMPTDRRNCSSGKRCTETACNSVVGIGTNREGSGGRRKGTRAIHIGEQVTR